MTPKKPDGTTYPPGTEVEIPGKDKEHPITVTIGKDGKEKYQIVSYQKEKYQAQVRLQSQVNHQWKFLM